MAIEISVTGNAGGFFSFLAIYGNKKRGFLLMVEWMAEFEICRESGSDFTIILYHL
jgi:hypothetical protein